MIYKLYCGRNIPASTETVSYQQFLQFLNDQKLFEGLTFYEAQGFWKGELERTFIIEIVTEFENKVVHLATLYKIRFRQESVLIVKSHDEADFQ